MHKYQLIRRMAFKHAVYALDIILGYVIILPLGVLYFRGSWDLWEHYVNLDCREESLLPGNETGGLPMFARHGLGPYNVCIDLGGMWVSGIAGCLAMILFNCLSPLMVTYITPETCTWPGFIVISRIYFYIFAFAYMGHWRGAWGLTDYYHGEFGWRQNLIGIGPSLGLSFLFRCSKMVMSTPWRAGFDIAEGTELKEHGHGVIFKSYSWFRTEPDSDGVWAFCLDHAYSQMVPLTLSVIVWRCWWNILDDTFIPWDRDLSCGVSVAVGLAGLLLCMAVCPAMVWVSTRLDSWPLVFKIIWEDFCYIFINMGVVFTWRGLWHFAAAYVIPDKVVGGWSCQFMGFVGLSLLCKFKSAFDNGIDIDGEDINGDGVKFEHKFFRYFLLRPEQENTKMLNKVYGEEEVNAEFAGNDGIEMKNYT